MPRHILPALFALGGVAACGGGGGGVTEEVARATTVTETYMDVSGFSEVTYDPSLDVYRVSYQLADGRRVVSQLGRNLSREGIVPAGFRVYGGDDIIVVRGETLSGAGNVYAIRDTFDGAGYGLERVGDTVLPTSGSATYLGGYSGVLADLDNSFTNLGQINGFVELTADFGDATIGGEINSRINGSGRLFDDLVLVETAIDPVTGGFASATAGGLFTGLDYDRVEGSYSGLIVGADGGEIVGAVEVVHTDAERVGILEMGGFIALD